LTSTLIIGSIITPPAFLKAYFLNASLTAIIKAYPEESTVCVCPSYKTILTLTIGYPV